MTEVTVSTHKKRRGVVRASITRLGTRLAVLERHDGAPSIDGARRMLQRLETLDNEFKTHHLALVDLTDDEEALGKEQDALDAHDDDISRLAERIQAVISAYSRESVDSLSSSSAKLLTKRLLHVQKGVSSVRESVSTMSTTSVDVCRLQQHEEQMADYKDELRSLSREILSLDLEEGDALLDSEAALTKAIFDCSVEIKRLLQSRSSTVYDRKKVTRTSRRS